MSYAGRNLDNKTKRALEVRKWDIIRLYSSGVAFERIAKKYKISRERVRQIWAKEARRYWKDDLERCVCRAEDVYWETELNRGSKLNFRYAWPKHQKTLKPYVPPPPKPVWILKIVTYPDGQFLGLAIVRGDNGYEAIEETLKLNLHSGYWVGEVVPDEANVVPGD